MIKNKRKFIGILALVVLLMSACAKTETTGEASANETADVEVQVENSVVDEQTRRDEFFISAEVLNTLEDENLIILDARGEDAYKGGHIEGALMTSWQSLSTMDVEFATATWGSVTNAEALSKSLSALGIEASSNVVVYADTEKGWGEEGRLYWTLKMAGLENVKNA